MPNWVLKILETPQEMVAVEDLQRLVWPGDPTEIVPGHLLLTAVHNGGLVVGAYETEAAGAEATRLAGDLVEESAEDWDSLPPPPTGLDPDARLIGFVFGFPGLYPSGQSLRLKHCSHMLGVHPGLRDQGIGFALKRAQWQMVRHQGLDLVTWTYDPLLSRNARLNIARLGAVCSTYRRNEYGEMRDDLNAGLPSDRLQVDWWVNSKRVFTRLSRKPRPALDLAHFLGAGVEILNRSHGRAGEWPRPSPLPPPEIAAEQQAGAPPATLLLVEIPADFQGLRSADPALALEWRLHIRALLEDLFRRGYLITDFVFLPGSAGRGDGRSFYILSHGESTF